MINHSSPIHLTKHYVVVQLVFDNVEGANIGDAIKRVENMKLKDKLGNLPELQSIIALQKN